MTRAAGTRSPRAIGAAQEPAVAPRERAVIERSARWLDETDRAIARREAE